MHDNERLRVLYVEDNSDSLEMVRVLLGMSQIGVEVAQSVSTALARARSEKFDLYLLDSGLPDGNGLNLCRSLLAAHPETPVLFYSGHAHPDEIKMGMAAGAAGYLIKPHSDKLVETILQLVENHRAKLSPLKSLPVLAASA